MTSAEQSIENRLHELLVRLRRGYLPGETMSAARAPAEQVAASAQQNLQHHAAGAVAPGGRPPAANRSGSSGSGSGSRSGSSGGGHDDGDGDDEDEEETVAEFRNYYRVRRPQCQPSHGPFSAAPGAFAVGFFRVPACAARLDRAACSNRARIGSRARKCRPEIGRALHGRCGPREPNDPPTPHQDAPPRWQVGAGARGGALPASARAAQSHFPTSLARAACTSLAREPVAAVCLANSLQLAPTTHTAHRRSPRRGLAAPGRPTARRADRSTLPRAPRAACALALSTCGELSNDFCNQPGSDEASPSLAGAMAHVYSMDKLPY